MSTRKQLHDQLLADKPAEVVHETCELCAETPNHPEGGTTQVAMYTEAEIDAAIQAAVADRDAQIASLTSAAQESEIEAKLAALQAAAEAEVEGLRAQLDMAVLERQAAIDELTAFKAELEEARLAEERAAEVAARRDERLAKVKEVASFPDSYLEQNADRFAAMSDEDFEARLAEYAALQPSSTGTIPAKTALSSSRETASTDTNLDAVRTLMRAGLTGTDPRTL